MDHVQLITGLKFAIFDHGLLKTQYDIQ